MGRLLLLFAACLILATPTHVAAGVVPSGGCGNLEVECGLNPGCFCSNVACATRPDEVSSEYWVNRSAEQGNSCFGHQGKCQDSNATLYSLAHTFDVMAKLQASLFEGALNALGLQKYMSPKTLDSVVTR